MDISSALHLRDTVLNNKVHEADRKLQADKAAVKAIDESSAKTFRKKQLKEVAQGFETIFLNMMFSSMRETLNKKDDILYGGFAQEVFEDMLYEKYSEEAASKSFLGLSDMIVAQYEKYV